MFDLLIHSWLRVPYALHTHVTGARVKPVATVLFIHGIGNSGRVWNPVIEKLPKDVRVVTIDLLGFGKSPQPSWIVYSAQTQARSVLATYLKLRLHGQVIIVGHSLGSLVAVEIAKRYPLLVRSLVLCSPPFYQLYDDEKRLLPRSDKILKNIYKTAQKHPEQFLQVATIAMRYKLINAIFSVTKENIDSYMGALEATIINQTSFADARKLQLPIDILHGTLDPVVVVRNLKQLAREQSNVTLTQVIASHEIKGLFIAATVKAVEKAYSKDGKNS
jgi:pimeloyl-ACP methyl ester carboxylesterase